jgi:hypothetical protein
MPTVSTATKNEVKELKQRMEMQEEKIRLLVDSMSALRAHLELLSSVVQKTNASGSSGKNAQMGGGATAIALHGATVAEGSMDMDDIEEMHVSTPPEDTPTMTGGEMSGKKEKADTKNEKTAMTTHTTEGSGVIPAFNYNPLKTSEIVKIMSTMRRAAAM